MAMINLLLDTTCTEDEYFRSISCPEGGLDGPGIIDGKYGVVTIMLSRGLVISECRDRLGDHHSCDDWFGKALED